MLIVCPSCISTYRMPSDAVRGQFSTVRCAQCGGVFRPESAGASALLHGVTHDGSVAALLGPPGGHLPGARASRVPPASNVAVRARNMGARVGSLVAVLIVAGMALVAERARVVGLIPGAETSYAAIGLPARPAELVLGGVSSALAEEGPAKVLTLQGTITNSRDRTVDVPNLRIVVRDAVEQKLYSWVAPAPRSRLAPGETTGFSSRLVSPPSNGHDLVVSFADPVAGAAAVKVSTSHEAEATGPGPVRP